MNIRGALRQSSDDSCECGHEREEHNHYRADSDCGSCRPCGRFRRYPGLLSRIFPGWDLHSTGEKYMRLNRLSKDWPGQ